MMSIARDYVLQSCRMACGAIGKAASMPAVDKQPRTCKDQCQARRRGLAAPAQQRGRKRIRLTQCRQVRHRDSVIGAAGLVALCHGVLALAEALWVAY